MSMRVKAALVIILIVFAITAANFVSSLIFTREGLIEAMEKWQTVDRDLANKMVSTQIFLLKSHAATVAVRLRNVPSKEEMIDVMKTQLEEFPDFMSFAVFTRDGAFASFGDLPASNDCLGDSRYLNLAFEGKSVITTSHYAPNDERSLVFHVCVPMEENRVLAATIPGLLFRDLVAEYRLWETGCIFILDEHGACLAYYDPQKVLERASFIELAKTDPTFKSIGEFCEKMISSKEGTGIYSLRGKERVCCYRKITASTMGWTIGVLAPIQESPHYTVQRGLFFSALLFMAIGTIVAIFLSNAVVRTFAKIEDQNRHLEKLNETVSMQAERIHGEHERARVLLDATPIACTLVDKDGKLIACNLATARIFGLRDKQEYSERFWEFSPEYQPNGQRSVEMRHEKHKAAFETGHQCYEWMCQKLDGSPLPCEVTLARIRYEDDHVLAVYIRDLREHKAMLAQMREKDEQARMMLDANPQGCQIWDENFNIIDCNTAVVNMFGFKDKQEYIDRFFELLPAQTGPNSTEMAFDYLKAALETGYQRFEAMQQLPDGTPFPCEVTLVRIPRDNGYMICGYTRDLREQKAMLAQINEANELTQAMLNATPLLGCSMWDEKLNHIDCNQELVKMFHLSSKQEAIERIFELSPEYQPNGRRSKDMMFERFAEALKTGYFRGEQVHQLLDGTPIPCEVTLVRVPRGNSYGICGYLRDMREHKAMMRDIEQRDKLLRVGNSIATTLLITPNENEHENSLLTSMEYIGRCFEVDRVQFWENETVDGELYFALKHQWISDFGQQKATVPIGLKHPYSQFPNWEKLFSRGEYLNGPVSERPQNEQIILKVAEIDSIVLIPLLLQKRFWGFFVLNDCHLERTFSAEEIDILHSAGLLMINAIEKNAITLNLRDTAGQLEVALDRAQEANQAKSAFLARMSHEMRTPLNAVLGLSVLALESGSLDAESRTNIEKIYNAGDMLLSTVNDILDISKIESGKFELILNEYDVPSLINDTTIQNMVRIASKPIEFMLDVDESLPARLYGDELRVKQIFNNLLSNACKHTMKGTIELGVHCTREEDSVWMTIRVQDTGSGIREKDFVHLFSDYGQVDTKSDRHIEGTGLGLPICKKLVEMMDGFIHVESEYGKGSVFTVRVRQKLVTNATIGSDLAENLKKFHYSDNKRVQNAKRTCPQMPYATILIVDDVITNLDVAKGLLKPYAMQIHCVVGGQQAIDAIRDEKVRYNAIFMDHMMPGVDGIEATRQIRQLGTEYAKSVPIIAMTANAIVGNEQMFLNSGFQAFLPKPLDIPRLDAIVRLWVRDKEQDKLLAERQIEVDGQVILDMRSNSDRRSEIDRRSGIDRRALQKIVETDMDMEAALQRFGDNWESLVNVLRSFVTNTPALLESIKEVNESNMANYAITVHGIKGASQGISADDAAAKALLLENAAKSGDFNFIKEHHSEFLESAFNLIAHIKTMLVEVDANSGKPQKDKPDSDALAKLLSACDNYDMDGVDAAMGEIEEYEYTFDDGLVAWLRQNVDQMNFTQIKEKLAASVR